MFDYGVNDDYLKVILEANKEVAITVKTPTGTSKEYRLTNTIMQGDTWAPAQASAQVDSFGKEMIIQEPNFMFKYKGEVSIPLLGQVDDLLGVSEVGFKAEQLNGFVNVKTADKELQFGIDKCNYMIVSKAKTNSFLKPALFVDSWKLIHNKNKTMEETFMGKIPMEEKNSLLYLGYMLSQNKSNMPNINHKKNKSKGTQKQIPKLIEPLGIYRFESAIIYIESLLRSSILYGAETMNNVKELEWRELEKIEEAVLSKVFKTTRSCSRHLLYLEAGMVPARFLVRRQMLAFLQYILQQPTDSLLHRVYQAQEESPSSGDWVSETAKILQDMKIDISNEEIKAMRVPQFKILIKKKTEVAAFEYLCGKKLKGKKGRELPHDRVQMSDYLLPDSCASLEEKFYIFKLRTEMNLARNNSA